MYEFEIMGPKEGDFKKYQTINYIEKNIAGIDAAAVDAFNMVAGRLFKWLQLSVESRKLDIVRRKALA